VPWGGGGTGKEGTSGISRGGLMKQAVPRERIEQKHRKGKGGKEKRLSDAGIMYKSDQEEGKRGKKTKSQNATFLSGKRHFAGG